MKLVKSHQFWVGVLAGVVLLAFFPQLNPRAALGSSKKPG